MVILILIERIKMKQIANIAAMVLLAFTIGCASTGNLNRYPLRRIDRPYTLPKGVASWEPTWDSNTLKHGDNLSKVSSTNILSWTQSVSDNLNIMWFPLPLALSYQLRNTDANTLGITFGISNFGYSDDEHLTLGLITAGYQKYKFAESLALVNEVSFSPVIRTEGNRSYSWEVQTRTGILIQMGDNFAILPAVHLSAEHNYPFIFDKLKAFEDKTYFLVPFSIATSWNINRQWEITTNYKFTSVGYPKNDRAEYLILGLIHYW